MKAEVIPALVTARAGAMLGAPVASVEMLDGGYTPQLLCRLTLADRRRAVLKAAARSADAPGVVDWASGRVDWASVLLIEARAYRALPMLRPWQPEIFGDVEESGWVALLMEDLSSADRVTAWADATLGIVARDLAAMHAATADTSPPPELTGDSLMELYFDQILSRGRRPGKLPASWGTRDGWAWIDLACKAGREAEETGFTDIPQCVVHGDVRSDNLFIRQGCMVLVDWPWAQWHSVARENVYWALGVEAEGGPLATMAHARYLAHARPIPERAIRGALTRQAAYFIDRLQSGTLPASLNAYFLSMLGPTTRWFAEALGLPPPLAHPPLHPPGDG